MSVQITIRNVPDEVRRKLAARAASAGQSMQEYLRAQLTELVKRPTPRQWAEAARLAKANEPKEIPAAEILEHRDADRR